MEKNRPLRRIGSGNTIPQNLIGECSLQRFRAFHAKRKHEPIVRGGVLLYGKGKRPTAGSEYMLTVQVVGSSPTRGVGISNDHDSSTAEQYEPLWPKPRRSSHFCGNGSDLYPAAYAAGSLTRQLTQPVRRIRQLTQPVRRTRQLTQPVRLTRQLTQPVRQTWRTGCVSCRVVHIRRHIPSPRTALIPSLERV
jgi:hypothetical protein